ncbi:fumarylacetoacetate hydrolase family protein [Marinobacter sp. NFXS9]|uniref:fumarylacetoacetate hydrolase family protein n=1 Tax=Marinobacter sp. NFXS9 TaxID=2818433 RepID=UPI0032E01E19
MKLATLKADNRDGVLVVVSKDLSRAVRVRSIAPTLQCAIENWHSAEPELEACYQALNAGEMAGDFPFVSQEAAAPLPRAYQWCDASAFLNHGKLMQQAFNLPAHEDAETTPLMYQGASDDFLGPCDDICLPDEADGIDFEGEYGVIVDDIPLGCPADKATSHIRLLVLVNDVSLRAFAPREMKSGFGFLHAKPSSSFGPVAVTPDELGEHWRNGRIELPLQVSLNGEWFGSPNGREMSFSFGELIAHAAKTRRLGAGTIVGSGTVSNADRSAGSACITERRTIEIIDNGVPSTPFLKFGDCVRMQVLDPHGVSVFGDIEQTVRPS